MLAVLITIECILLLLLILTLPVKAVCSAALSLRGGRIEIDLRYLGLTVGRIYFKLTLFDEPYFCLQRIKKDGSAKLTPLLKKNRERKPDVFSLSDIKELSVNICLGIKDESALTVWVLGSLHELASFLIKDLASKTQVSVLPAFDKNIFRINLDGILLLIPLHIIVEAIRMRRNKVRQRRGKGNEYAAG